MGKHLQSKKGNLHFKSDKYPWAKEDFVPLKVTDKDAQLPLLMYAMRHRQRDTEFSHDLLEILKTKGVDLDPKYPLLFKTVFEPELAELDNKDFDRIKAEIQKKLDKMTPAEMYFWHISLHEKMYEDIEATI